MSNEAQNVIVDARIQTGTSTCGTIAEPGDPATLAIFERLRYPSFGCLVGYDCADEGPDGQNEIND